jgi:DNA polymerase-4
MPPFTAPDATLRWLFIDMNSYFASVEQQDRPSLRGKPVAVVPVQSDSTCAIAASYEAKAYGIKTGTIIGDARRKCPNLICVLARHHKYVDYHHKILAEIDRHVPITKVCSVDELSSRLSPLNQTEDRAVALAHAIKAGLKTHVGEYIRCSIGIAPNSFLAKVATDMMKPDGLVILRGPELPEKLFPLKLTDLPGINTRMEQRLWRANIRTIEDLWRVSPKQARAAWGSVEGERFWYNLHGHEIPDRITHKSMVGHSRVLDPDLRPVAAAWSVAHRLTVKAATRLRSDDYYATRFTLSVRTSNNERWAREIRLSPAQDDFVFAQAVQNLWAAMRADLNPTHIKKISVILYGLCGRGEITPDLFEQASPAYQKLVTRHEKLSGVIDQINIKHGRDAVRLGETPATLAGYLGTKIAFTRVPEMGEFVN